MKLKKIAFVYIWISVSPFILIAESQTANGEFSIDKNLVPSLYESTVQEVRGENGSKFHSGVITPQLSIVMPIEMQLTNKYFTIPYEKNVSSLPMFSLLSSTSSPLIKKGFFGVYGQASIGYGYTEGIYDVKSKSNLDLKDTVKLHWIPAFVALRTEYAGLSFLGVNLFLVGGIGEQWLYQSGMLDGMEQGFWIPTAQIGGGIAIFGNANRERENFFQNIRLGATYQKSLFSTQELRAWSVDLAVNLAL